MIYYITFIVILLIVLGYKWRDANMYENLYRRAINTVIEIKNDKITKTKKDRENIENKIDKKFLSILRIAENEDSPKNRFDLGYERGRFEIEVENLWLMGGITYQMKFRLIECGKIASRSEGEE